MNFIITNRVAGEFNQPGINGNAFIDGQPFHLELTQDFGIDLIHGLF